MPHFLYYASLLISDSQTMSAESGVLGTPYIRYNDFVGMISYLNDLENTYNLGIGIKTKDKDLLFKTIEELLSNADLKSIWKKREENVVRKN
jgi:predicted glycosyltransferase